MDMFQHLKTFVRIAETQNISQAARNLNLSVAMASRHLGALEEHLGVELMRRTTRRTALTPAGEEFLLRARKLLGDLEEAREAVRPGVGAAGLVVMSLPISFGLSQIMPLIAELLEVHPRLQFDVHFDDRVVDLLSAGVDIAIRAGITPPDSPFVMARKLVSFERILCASPSFLEAHAPIYTMLDLVNLPCITSINEVRWKYMTEDGPQSIDVQGRLRTSTMLAKRDAVVAGVGIAMLPGWMVKDELAREKVVQVLPEIKMPKIDVHGLYHQGVRRSQTIRAVLDYLAQGLSKRIGST
jgi:DNA-binding transcriptional LysR family regulator